MASFDQVRDSYSGNFHHGRSKAHISLNKILHIISCFPPGKTSKELSFRSQFDGSSDENRALCCGKRGFGIDLNLRLGPLSEMEEFGSPAGDEGLSESSAVGTVVERSSPAVEKSSESECEPEEGGKLYGRDSSEIQANRNGEGVEVVGEKAAEVSEITIEAEEEERDNELQGDDGDDGGKTRSFSSKQCRSDGFLGLLIEAAELISGEFEDDEPERDGPSQNDELGGELNTPKRSETETAIDESMISRRSKSKRDECLMADLYGDFEDISPVVRSKRGRSQVLPYRYRDSVLEPWRRLSRQRSTTVSTKRRSR